MAFDGEGSWSFDNDFVRNVIIFGVDNSLSSRTDDGKNNFLVLGKVPTGSINHSTDRAEKIYKIKFSKANIKFCVNYLY